MFNTPLNSTLKFSIEVDADGNITNDSAEATGSKSFSIKYFKTFSEPEDNVLNTGTNAYSLIELLVNRIVVGTFLEDTIAHSITRKYEG